MLTWKISPNELGDPGLLNDPDPLTLQDGGLNSSFVIQASLNGKPLTGVQVSWKTSDVSSQIEVVSKTTDVNGEARIWFINGLATSNTVMVSIDGTIVALEKKLARNTVTKKTVGRPVIVSFIPQANQNYDKVSITASIKTDPVGTYYAFANFSNFYTGVQSVWCNGWLMYEKVCSENRGVYKGREGHFSVWDGKSSTGTILTPKVVDLAGETKCSPFDHEGSGQMCMVAFDWLPRDKVTINIEKITGAPIDYARLKVSAMNATTGKSQFFATIDVPGGVNLSTEFASFNEHYLVGSADNCLAAEERSFTINRVEFISGLTVSKPVRAYAYGNVVAEGATLCQNYGFENTADGIEIHSGGSGRWVTFLPALNTSGSRKFFRDEQQSKIMIRDIPLGSIGG